jgi:hypothetical protein
MESETMTIFTVVAQRTIRTMMMDIPIRILIWIDDEFEIAD